MSLFFLPQDSSLLAAEAAVEELSQLKQQFETLRETLVASLMRLRDELKQARRTHGTLLQMLSTVHDLSMVAPRIVQHPSSLQDSSDLVDKIDTCVVSMGGDVASLIETADVCQPLDGEGGIRA